MQLGKRFLSRALVVLLSSALVASGVEGVGQRAPLSTTWGSRGQVQAQSTFHSQQQHNGREEQQQLSFLAQPSFVNFEGGNKQLHAALAIYGGAISDDDDDSDSDSESDSDSDIDDYDMTDNESDPDSETDSESESEVDSEDEYDESEYDVDEDDSKLAKVTKSKAKLNGKKAVVQYDEQFYLSPFQQMGVTLGVMLLTNKLDLTNETIIRSARYAFIGYLIAMQLFLAYVRYRAKAINDTTEISISNSLSSLLQNQAASVAPNGETGDMVKNLASSFLSTTSTVVDYDLSQAKSMNNALLFPLLSMWFLHFRMGQVQPLFFSIANGVKDMLSSPLFQVYGFGKNLERPFKNMQIPQNEDEDENEGEIASQSSDDEDENDDISDTGDDSDEEDDDVEDDTSDGDDEDDSSDDDNDDDTTDGDKEDETSDGDEEDDLYDDSSEDE